MTPHTHHLPDALAQWKPPSKSTIVLKSWQPPFATARWSCIERIERMGTKSGRPNGSELLLEIKNGKDKKILTK
jgi:hypothetical protein